MGKIKDLTGQRFGRLTVLARAEDYVSPKGVHTSCWRCRCDCGNEIIVRGGNLKNGRTKSCGCIVREKNRERAKDHIIDLTGQRFGKLVVIEQAEDYIAPYRHEVCWKCECDCGNTVVVRGRSLRNGDTRSCGCLHNEVAKNHPTNHFEFKDNYVVGTTGRGKKFFFDIDDYEKVSQHNWELMKSGYVVSKIRKKTVLLHRFVMGCNSDDVVDHINHDKKDCRKENLRIVTPKENSMNHTIAKNNKSGHTGVFWHKDRHKWVASISSGNKERIIGDYNNKEEAIEAREEAEERLFGEYSYKNSMAVGPEVLSA